MNKNVIIGLVVIVLAAGGYYQFSYKPAQDAAMAAAQKATEDAAAAAKLAEEEAAAAAKKVADEAAAAAAAATTAATDTAAAATTAATDTAAAATDMMAQAAALLDPTKFDAAKINDLIAKSPLDDATKATLKTGIDAAAANPAMVATAIDAVKKALGM